MDILSIIGILSLALIASLVVMVISRRRERRDAMNPNDDYADKKKPGDEDDDRLCGCKRCIRDIDVVAGLGELADYEKIEAIQRMIYKFRMKHQEV